MTREKAVAVGRALDAIDAFEAFMEQIDRAVIDTEDWVLLSPDFKLELDNLMQAELMRLKSILEEM